MTANIATRLCEGIGCDNAGVMQCPTCKKLGTISVFCTQDCFKKNWGQHKFKHTAPPAEGDPWPTYSYTGELRPHYPLSSRRPVPEHIPRPDYHIDGIPKSEQTLKAAQIVQLNDPKDLLKMRLAGALGRLVLDHAASLIRVGITTDEIDAAVHDICIKYGAYPSPLNYRNLPKSVCISVNEVICHGIPDKRPLQDGDIVNLDVTVYYNGFHGDLNETYIVTREGADLDDPRYAEAIKLINSARTCMEEGTKICRPGVRFREIGNVISKVAQQNGHSVVRTYCGHGIHRLFHCVPNIPHYANNKAIGTMKVGNTFTIEPMINAGSWHDVTWPDNWTSCTKDGKWSAQFEQGILITHDGYEILTRKGADKIYFDENGLKEEYRQQLQQ
ncbi:hypothetical protein MIR68_004015 [Amoeboaphelidium protococcarum]|nr:hypothetical protein MIR68_004015 [Amoeboaphelidium protococcarum]